MQYKKLEKYILSKKGSFKDFPFGEDTAVYKVISKMFVLVSLEEKPLRMNLKCHPDDTQILRSLYKSVIPGYHMNKEHWNSVMLDDSVPEDALFKMIDDSYDLVVKGLKKAERLQLEE